MKEVSRHMLLIYHKKTKYRIVIRVILASSQAREWQTSFENRPCISYFYWTNDVKNKIIFI